MKNTAVCINWRTASFLLGLSLANPAWSADSLESADVVTDISLEEIAPRCPPLNEDDRWLLRRTQIMANGMRTEADITVTIISVGGEIAVREWAADGAPPIYSEIRRESGILYPVKDTVSPIEIDYTSEVPICPPPKVGESIVGLGSLNGRRIAEQITTITAIEPFFVKVVVPAGTFNTRKISSRVTVSGPETVPPHTITHYFADRIGAVKEIFRFPDGSVQIHELLEFNFQ